MGVVTEILEKVVEINWRILAVSFFLLLQVIPSLFDKTIHHNHEVI